MIEIQGIWWPDDVGTKWKHSLSHVVSLDTALAWCKRHRTAVQAGGNIGLWPRRLAQVFDRVLTFEPDAISRACLERNVPKSVEIYPDALGDQPGRCDIAHKSLGSHRITAGDRVAVTTIDGFALADLDFLQLDIEGYEYHALLGGAETIRRCKPLIQLELRGFTEKYGQSDAAVRRLLVDLGYRSILPLLGADVLFEARR